MAKVVSVGAVFVGYAAQIQNIWKGQFADGAVEEPGQFLHFKIRAIQAKDRVSSNQIGDQRSRRRQHLHSLPFRRILINGCRFIHDYLDVVQFRQRGFDLSSHLSPFQSAIAAPQGRNREKIDVKHYLMVDAHYTWWNCGKSYLCRIIDMLHMGYVDEVIFGREVIAELPRIVKEWVVLARRGRRP